MARTMVKRKLSILEAGWRAAATPPLVDPLNLNGSCPSIIMEAATTRRACPWARKSVRHSGRPDETWSAHAPAIIISSQSIKERKQTGGMAAAHGMRTYLYAHCKFIHHV